MLVGLPIGIENIEGGLAGDGIQICGPDFKISLLLGEKIGSIGSTYLYLFTDIPLSTHKVTCVLAPRNKRRKVSLYLGLSPSSHACLPQGLQNDLSIPHLSLLGTLLSPSPFFPFHIFSGGARNLILGEPLNFIFLGLCPYYKQLIVKLKFSTH